MRSGNQDNRGNRLGGSLSILARFQTVLLGAMICLAGDLRAGEDPRDAPVITAMVKQTLEFERTGTDLPWSNPETGSRGVIRVERTYYLDTDTPCRDYTRTTRRPDGDRITTRGTGCRMSDGRWFLDEALGGEVSPPSKAPPAATARPTSPKDTTAAPAESLKAEAPAVPAVKAATEAPRWDKPADEETAEAYAPAPPPAKPKVLAPDYTLPSRSAP